MRASWILTIALAASLTGGTLRAEKKPELIPVYAGSNTTYDDNLGFNPFSICTGTTEKKKAKIEQVEGHVRHRFSYAPAGRSAFEIIKNYENAVRHKEGEVFEVAHTKECINAFMKGGHPPHGMTNFEYMQLPRYGGDYFAGKVSVDGQDYYVAVAAGSISGKVVYSLVTVQAKSMDTGMVTLDNLAKDLLKKGHIAIYDIYFDSGKSEVKEASHKALETIAAYMKAHADNRFYVVGHTDNVGGFEMNLRLSAERAKAVVNALARDFGVAGNQLKAHGAGPLAPVRSNRDGQGKAKNRRVEIVEQ